MGLKLGWQDDLISALSELAISIELVESHNYKLLCCNSKLIINLVSLNNKYSAAELIELQSAYQSKNIYLVQLWEDVWLNRQVQVLGRITSILGLNKRLHARKSNIISINQQQADCFLNENHIQATAKAKYKFALSIDNQIVAVACFSGVRSMKEISPDYKSAELIRFATLIGYTITGGFSKIIRYFINLIAPNDIMSYADRDWSLGNAYEQSGFTLVALTPSAKIWLQKTLMLRFFSHRLPVTTSQLVNQEQSANPDAVSTDEFLPVFNTGNLKYILYLK